VHPHSIETPAGDSHKDVAVLYLTYDGVLEPLGQSQVLEYLKGISAKGGYSIHLVSFEKAADWADEARRERAKAEIGRAGIRWKALRYHKRPSLPATAFDIAMGVLAGIWICRSRKIRIVHVRSYVPAVIGLALKALLGVRLVFDMRGFWADERVDGGIWRRDSLVYRLAKRFEKSFLLHSDVVVSLTRSGVEEMRSFDYLKTHPIRYEVIPTCANLELFKPGEKRAAPGFTLGAVGSVDHWYLFEPSIRAFRFLKESDPESRFLILNRGQHEFIRSSFVKAGTPMSSVELAAVDHREVAVRMARMSAGVFFIRPVFSKKASAPTKLGEFLGCGVPCLSNAGVGDMAEILEGEGVGVVVRDFEDATLRQAVLKLVELSRDPGVRDRCVRAARKHFSLAHGVDSYRTIYGSLTGASP
jgi:glycosyltransferase involved in cell wall biosynthesis